ncbi:protocadherin-9-like [Gigantopelta aegis]|uniref:protocadherin-9-like n=1 Tax=Gigantopelta aegis TaxID=1735272 RepID=UPI001B88DE27|nr:protocadherin-9-like [Gigantopelta aegis]XP_041359662.1 protocadherin-9-like [Gigantopelta aegis]XP_041359663.1 protocadherin-9-like [Gigantopelta aegis]
MYPLACFMFILDMVYLSQTANPDLVFRIDEELPIKSYVGNISDNKSVFNNISSADRQKLKFGILDKTGTAASLFETDVSTGVMRVAKRIDRETVCDISESFSCYLDLNIAIHSVSPTVMFNNVASVRIFIRDTNDNQPTFPASEVRLEVSEGAKVGTVLKISGAVDRDSLPNNTIQRYTITEQQGMFSLTSERNPDGSSIVNLKLEKPLNREQKNLYTFRIIAYDGGSPPKTGGLNVIVTITDENDNPPKFLKPSYDVTVKEDALPNHLVVRVSASDPDEGDNGRVTYHFSRMQSSKLQSLFSINSTTGEIRVLGKLEYDASKPHQLIVEALDGGVIPLKTQTVVTVTILDSGNNAPIVNINTLSTENTRTVELSEAARVGFFVAYVDVEDSDTGNNGEVQCETPSQSFKLEKLTGGKGYKVLVKRKLNREMMDKFKVIVFCWDNGTPSLNTTAFFQVVITDENDNSPRFVKNPYTASVPENSSKGTTITQVLAEDLDTGENGKIKYHLESSVTAVLRIRPDTGVITTNGVLDRESTPLIKFKVFATDNGIPKLTGTAEVILTVMDVNDITPAFKTYIFEFNITENQEHYVLVGRVEAFDNDEGRNGQIEYFIAETPTGMVPFTVLSNGTVIATESLDRELRSAYRFTVLARDKGSPPRTNSTEVRINVLDLNDHAPQILFPKSPNHTIHITDLPKPNSVIGKIVAFDPDFGENKTLQFFISKGNDEGVFTIDRENGETKVSNVWKMQREHVYELKISVQDSGNPPRSVDTNLFVDVRIANETKLDMYGEKSEKYVVIAATVAAATCILSIVIIAAICYILRSDKRKPYTSSNRFTEFDKVAITPEKSHTAVAVGKQTNIDQSMQIKSQTDKNTRGESVSQKPISKPDSGGYRKKEVSFSIDESDGGPSQDLKFREVLRGVPDPNGPRGNKPNDLLFTNPTLSYIDDKDKILHLDDVHSDTSGETIPSDSGRGGSEEEVNFQHSSNPHFSWDPERVRSKNNSRDNFSAPQTKHNNIPVKPERQNRVRFLHTNSFQEGRTFNPHPPTMTPSSRFSSPGVRHPLSVQRESCDLIPRNDPVFIRQHSNHSQDDDVSTTTSGSYTVNNDDFLGESFLGKDVIV